VFKVKFGVQEHCVVSLSQGLCHSITDPLQLDEDWEAL